MVFLGYTELIYYDPHSLVISNTEVLWKQMELYREPLGLIFEHVNSFD